MKRLIKTAALLILTGLLPFTMAFGQEKKTEKKIKVVVADKDGEKTVLDTVFLGDNLPEEITLEDGKVVFIASDGKKGEWTVTDPKGSESHVYVFSGSDGPEIKTEKIIISSSPDGKMEWQEKGGKKMIIVSDTKEDVSGDSKTIHVRVSDKDIDHDTDMTKYVIAKDGVVVTVETDDEAKAKEIIKEVEKKLDIKK